MKIKTISTLLMIAMLIIVGCAESSTREIIKENKNVCAIMPVSGPFAIIGEEMAKGLELAAVENNYDFKLEDDGYDFKKTVTATRKLIQEGCDEIIVTTIEEAKPILPIAEEAEVPVITLLDRTIEVKENDYLFSTGFGTEGSGREARRLVNKNDKIIVIRDMHDWAIIISDAFGEVYENKIAYTLNEGEDFNTLITKIKQEEPDVIYFAIAINDAVDFVTKIKEQGIEAQLITGDGFTIDHVMAASDAANGICKTDLPAMTKELDVEMIVPEFVGLAYDGANAVIQAKEEAKENNIDYLEALKNTKVKSVFGDIIDMNPNAPDRVETLYCIEDGELYPIN